jgi:hypothetical protein
MQSFGRVTRGKPPTKLKVHFMVIDLFEDAKTYK